MSAKLAADKIMAEVKRTQLLPLWELPELERARLFPNLLARARTHCLWLDTASDLVRPAATHQLLPQLVRRFKRTDLLGGFVETRLTDVYQFRHRDYGIIHLIDTPGFDDTYASDADVLREIASFLSSTYQSKVKLTGLIYLHRISDNRIAGSALRNLRMFKELCGEDAYKHVALATSMWSKEDPIIAARREQELIDDGGFWKAMKERGSSVVRWLGDAHSASHIVQHLLEAHQDYGAVSLKIQRELVDEGKTLVDTSAGQEVNREMAELRANMEKKLQQIQQDNRDAMATQDVQWQQSLLEQRAHFENQRQMAEESQDALRVNLERLLAETGAKYRNELDNIRDELRRAEEEMQHARELNEHKDQIVKELKDQLTSAHVHTVEEQQRLQQQLIDEMAKMEAARKEEEKLRRDMKKRKEEESQLLRWLKRIGAVGLPVLGTVAASAVSAMLGPGPAIDLSS